MLMETIRKDRYEAPAAEVVVAKMENGILTASTGSPEKRENGGSWGDGGWY